VTLFTVYQNYHNDLVLAEDGAARLQDAESVIKGLTSGSFSMQDLERAHQDFITAASNFTQVQSDLEQVPGFATNIPKYGALLHPALHILPLAIELSQAGITGTNMLNLILSRLANPFNGKGQGLTPADLTTIRQDIAQIEATLNTAVNQINHLQPADLQVDPRIGPAIASFRAELPKLQSGMQTIQEVLNVAPTILGIGQPASYLIEQMDSTELRPGGGFIGTYGIATVSGGRLSNIFMTDVDLLDHPFEANGGTIPFPPQYQWFTLAPTWSLRDSNLDADFPTSAYYGEQNYHLEGGNVALQGVIAITPWFIKDAMEVTGPIYVSEYHETVTAQNLIDRIHYHQLKAAEGADYVPSPDGHSSLRKRFTSYLFATFMQKVSQVASKDMGKFVHVIATAMQTKDIQIYFNSPQAEALLQQYHLASTIQAPPGDGSFVVDANVIANKANDFITYNRTDQITIDAAGDAVHTTTLTYSWPVSTESTQNDYYSHALPASQYTYEDYLRIYVPTDSVLDNSGILQWMPIASDEAALATDSIYATSFAQMQSGGGDTWQFVGTSQAFNRQVWAGRLTLLYGSTATLTFTWKVPNAAVHDARGWHYHYLIQKQAGVTWNVHVQVTLPSCASIIGKPIGLVAHGKQDLTLNQPLATDTDLEVDYTC